VFVQPLLQWSSNKYYIFWVCTCSFRYPACNANVAFCHLWPVQLHCIFPYYLINGMICTKKLLNIKCSLYFSLKFLLETFLILRNECHMIKNVYWHFVCVVLDCHWYVKIDIHFCTMIMIWKDNYLTLTTKCNSYAFEWQRYNTSEDTLHHNLV
jgi:hypothetical protein